jgi:hypothetical protein
MNEEIIVGQVALSQCTQGQIFRIPLIVFFDREMKLH